MSGNLRPSKSLPQKGAHVCTWKRKMHDSRRSSADTCSTEASSKHVIAEKDRKPRHSMPVLSSTSLANPLSSSGASWEHLEPESPSLLATSTDQSTGFNSAGLDPPITQAVLSELDILRLENDPVFRHHLNFDPQIEFRINTQEPQAGERREREVEYWDAMATEITSWLAHCQSIAACPSSGNPCVPLFAPGARSFPQGSTSMLLRLFETVRDILKHSLHPREWPSIDASLDIGFLMQQLEHGVCDFTALSHWLAKSLRRHCSPKQDRLLHTMISAIRLGVENADANSIVQGLITIFEILQGMNLVK